MDKDAVTLESLNARLALICKIDNRFQMKKQPTPHDACKLYDLIHERMEKLSKPSASYRQRTTTHAVQVPVSTKTMS